MIPYNTFEFFIVYFGLTFIVYTILPKKVKWCALLIGSVVYYVFSANGNFVSLLVSAASIWLVGIIIQKFNDEFAIRKKEAPRTERKALKAKYKKKKLIVLNIGIIINIGLLLTLKYGNFFVGTFGSIFRLDVPTLKLVQPLGISFYTLQAVSYITDVYRGKHRAERNPLKLLTFLSFMLTIMEGPIARWEKLGPQFTESKKIGTKDLYTGAVLIGWGLFKKVVIADRAAILVNNIFNDFNAERPGIIVFIGILCYTLQLYCDFSGIMDVINGLALLLGIEMPENFTRPFFAKSINEFWQRWHITLGSWLRDYIFYPISLSKPFMSLTKSARKKFNPYYANLIPTAVALFFVWFSNGLWHGSAWKYIVYGLYYYVLMMLGLFCEPLSAKVCAALRINRKSKAFAFFQMVRTFFIVNFGMLIFRANTLTVTGQAVKAMVTNPQFSAVLIGTKNGLGLGLLDYVILALGFFTILFVGIAQERGIVIREKLYKLPYPVRALILLAGIVFIIIFGAYGEHYGVPDLLYANF